MPAARQVSRSPCIALAIIAMIRGRAARPFAVDAAGGLQAVHRWHLDVHEDYVVRPSPKRLERLQPVGGDVGPVA
jgi:hypothetical protein